MGSVYKGQGLNPREAKTPHTWKKIITDGCLQTFDGTFQVLGSILIFGSCDWYFYWATVVFTVKNAKENVLIDYWNNITYLLYY